MPTNVRQPYYPPIDSNVPASVATHLKIIYTGLNQHDQILNVPPGASTSTPTTPSNSVPTGGGATGTITLAALTTGGTQGSITVSNGLITSYTAST